MHHHVTAHLNTLRVEDLRREAHACHMPARLRRQHREAGGATEHISVVDRVLLRVWARLSGTLERRGVLRPLPGPLGSRGPLSS
ncbi:hypothetical protein HNQ07_001749 [Deinococcus metalli]|uniref:Uncharacterized protein n=1 Tax=Deinococcus metalli TaxID=1141878 RepID=A0A7W8KDQ4_9DEIO|nr:hypothetical protein [Deinococcus metalli]MBB5376292.1 hypothetical protein [Deinococcus metalli]GHF39406.1 hypothetical protein GCM10017781_14910 [Deinococcus metalli]